MSRLFVGALIATVAVAAPARGVVATVGKVTTPLTIFLKGAETWTLTATGKDAQLTLNLPTLAVGTQQGKDARLTVGATTHDGGAWTLAITAAEVGHLKMPGVCSGTLTVLFEDGVRVDGAFKDAGCLSMR